MYLSIATGGIQVSLFTLKLLGLYTGSWWIVFIPTMIWIVLSILGAAVKDAGMAENDHNETDCDGGRPA